MGASTYPGALDDFAAASPTYLSDDDTTGRDHAQRHDDVEAAIEAVQAELGTDPAGAAATVKARLDAVDTSLAGKASTTHASTHASAGSDPVTIAQSQVTNLTTDLAAKAPLASPTFTGTVTFPNGTVGVKQVKSTTKVDTFTTTSTSLVDVTGLSVSITPSSASNLVLVMVSLALVNNTAGGTSRGAIIRGSTQIAGGTAAGSRGSATFRSRPTNTADTFLPQHFTYLDSPATTSATTYKVQIMAESGTTAMVGYSAGVDSDNANYPRLACSITVMEVTP